MANVSDLGLGLREEPGCARTGRKLFNGNYLVFGHDRALPLIQRESQWPRAYGGEAAGAESLGAAGVK